MAINELRSISVFVKAAELGSLRKAAGALDISPQAASQALAQLEEQLDVRLFHRTTRVMSLTDEGRRFLEEAQPALQGLQRASQAVKAAKDEIAGPLRVVGPRTAFQPILAALSSHHCSTFRNPETGKILPWHIQLDGQAAELPVVPAIRTNDEVLELHAVLAGKVLGQLAGVTAAPYIRSAQLVPILLDYMPNSASYFIYFGSRTSQPARARAFINLAVERLTDNPEYILNGAELAAAQRRMKT